MRILITVVSSHEPRVAFYEHNTILILNETCDTCILLASFDMLRLQYMI